MTENNVATFRSGNKEIWDYRNLPFKIKLKIAFNLLFFGIVDIKWKAVKNNHTRPEEITSKDGGGVTTLTETSGRVRKTPSDFQRGYKKAKEDIEKKIDARLIVLEQHSDLENVRAVIRELRALKKEIEG